VGGGPVSISGGQGAVKANLLVRGNDLSGTMNLEALGLKVAPLSAEKKDRVTLVLNSLLQGITEAKIGIGVSGTIKSPQFTLNSSIDNQLRGALKGAADQQTAQLRADLEKQINALVGKETEKLSALVDKNAVSALEKLNLSDKDLVDVQEKIKKAMDDLAKSGTQGIKLPDLKGLFKKR
jgi:nitrogen-specific signal transduction histidine kinase